MSTITYDVLTVIERDRGKTFFKKIGVAFTAKDGDGYNISLDALPIGGQMLLRAPKAEPKDNGGAVSAPLTPVAARAAEGAAPAPGHKRFSVTVFEWLSYDIEIDAKNARAAERLADHIWNTEGTEPFRFRDSGVDGIHVEEEAVGRCVASIEDGKAVRHG
jgi:hypothetical protein